MVCYRLLTKSPLNSEQFSYQVVILLQSFCIIHFGEWFIIRKVTVNISDSSFSYFNNTVKQDRLQLANYVSFPKFESVQFYLAQEHLTLIFSHYLLLVILC